MEECSSREFLHAWWSDCTPKPIKIDFVFDVSCPWCVIGLRALEEALDRTSDVVDATVKFQLLS